MSALIPFLDSASAPSYLDSVTCYLNIVLSAKLVYIVEASGVYSLCRCGQACECHEVTGVGTPRSSSVAKPLATPRSSSLARLA
jgi:hypothetical protein